MNDKIVQKFQIVLVILLFFVSGDLTYGQIIVDFELCSGSNLTLFTEDDVKISPDGVGTFTCDNTNCPNGTKCPFPNGDPNPSLRAEFPTPVVEVSVDLGDQGSDAETLFVRAFNSNDELVDSTQLSISATDQSMHTLTVSGSGITYVVSGSFGGLRGASVFTDNILFVPQESILVGGKIIPINNISLLLSFVQINAFWILPFLALVGIWFMLIRKNFNL